MEKSGSFGRKPTPYRDGFSTAFLHGQSVARIEPSSIRAINEGTDALLRSIKIGKVPVLKQEMMEKIVIHTRKIFRR
jgi:hypothetical protein